MKHPQMSMTETGKGVKNKANDKRWGKSRKRQKLELEEEEEEEQDLYKPPTSQELNSLKQTEDLFHSSLFRLQIEELLSEVKLKKSNVSAVSDYVQSLTSFLSNLNDEKFSDVHDVSWTKQTDVVFPLCETHVVGNERCEFTFRRPKHIKVIGAFALGLAIRPNVTVDVALQMSKETLCNSDGANHSYHRTRAIYLACLARKLKDNEELYDSLSFTYFQGDLLKPVLLVKPKGQLSKRFTFAIHPYPCRSSFKLGLFEPMRSNVSSSLFFRKKKKLDSVVDNPTPKYNTSILVDLTFELNFAYASAVIGDSDNVRDGIILLKVWLHQRELDQGSGSFSSFIMTMYIVFLLQAKKLNAFMSSYQIARNVWLNLKQSDWSVEGISLAQLSESGKQPPTLIAFHSAFEVVFVDPSGYVNLCATMSKLTFERVRHEAELAIGCLDRTDSNSFCCLFMTPLPFLRRFDHIFRVCDVNALQSAVQKCNLEPLLVDNCGDYSAVIVSKMIEVLKSGLGARVKFIDMLLRPPPKWRVDERPPSAADLSLVSIGLLLDPLLSMSIIDKGPPADSSEAIPFREFWESKSELRRFHDSSICEAVVWPADSISDRRMVCEHIVRFVLERHVGIAGESVRYIGCEMDTLLGLRFPKDHEFSMKYGTGEERTVDVLTAYDSLVKQLRSLDDLALKFSSIQGISAVFRYTEVFPQLPLNYDSCSKSKSRRQLLDERGYVPPLIRPQTVVLKLEASNKWPHDLDAIRHLKAAFYIQLCRQLRKKCRLLCSPYPDCIDVFKEGYVFRLFITTKQELVALKVVRGRSGVVESQNTKQSTDLEIFSELMPKLTSSLHGLQMNHGCFSSTCRLAKRWVASQLLTDYVPDVSIELIVSQLYLSPFPFTPPNCPQVGFLRFLQLLVNHDWKNVPFIVNLNEDLKKEEVTEISNRFMEKRSSLPAMFIATPYDKFESLITREKPTLQIMHRLLLLATETARTIEDQLSISGVQFNPKIAFRPPLEPYDVVIHLDQKKNPVNFMAVDSCLEESVQYFGKCATDTWDALPVVGYDPTLRYLKELREVFDHLALFFYDPFGGSFIGVLFKPQTFIRQQFKVGNVKGMMVSKRTDVDGKNVEMVPNVKAIIDDFKIIGRGLVWTVEAKEERWDFE